LSLGAMALGDDSGVSIGDGEELGATMATDAAGLGELAAPALPADSRAIATRANATIIKPTRAACDTARSSGHAIRGDVSRGGSRLGDALRQPPDSAMRYGQTVPVVGRSGWLPGD